MTDESWKYPSLFSPREYATAMCRVVGVDPTPERVRNLSDLIVGIQAEARCNYGIQLREMIGPFIGNQTKPQ